VAIESSSPTKAGFLTRIESVRGLAAVCVALMHTMGYVIFTDNDFAYGPLLELQTVRDVAIRIGCGLLNAEMAVTVFFVISGVVIGRSLDSSRAGRQISREFGPFMIRRIFRLYPAHFVAIIGIVGLAQLFLVGRPPLDFAAFAGTYPAESTEGAAWVNGRIFNPLTWRTLVGNLLMASWTMNLVVWSLYVEMCAAPFLPFFHQLSRKVRAWVDVATLAALIGLSLLNWEHVWSRYLFVFYLGMIVETRGLHWARALERTLGGSGRALALCYLLMAGPTIVLGQRPAPVILAEAFGAFSVISLIVLSETRPPFRWLEWPLLRWNGRLSYSFYLWHFFILTIVVHQLYATLSPDFAHRFDIPIFMVTAIVTIAIALGVAQLSFTYIELPSVALGRTFVALWRRIAARRHPPELSPAHVASVEPGRVSIE
jgi:peptidoglycan/LPS O-acetylase OafA/YrhL